MREVDIERVARVAQLPARAQEKHPVEVSARAKRRGQCLRQRCQICRGCQQNVVAGQIVVVNVQGWVTDVSVKVLLGRGAIHERLCGIEGTRLQDRQEGKGGPADRGKRCRADQTAG